MRKKLLLAVAVLGIAFTCSEANAYWMWSPDTGKWVNPKKSAKDTPEDQLAWAMDFYNKKDWGRAIEEFEKLPAAFPTSRLAAEGAYFAGLCYEEKQDIAKAADAYEKLVDRYPYSDRIKDAIGREFKIADEFAKGSKVKVLGVPALPGQDKAIEIYKHIVKNAPFGTFGDQAQYQIGEVHKLIGDFEEAQKAYQTVVDEYPKSELVAKARYQIAYCSMQASQHAQYNEQSADRAIQEFQGFKQTFPSDKQALEADESIKALRNKKAETQFEVAQFYERNKKYASARVYYLEVATSYADTPYAEEAKKKVQEVSSLETQPAAKPWYRLW